MENKYLAIYFNMFTAGQMITLFDNGNIIDLGKFNANELPGAIRELCEQYDVDNVKLIGDHMYLEKIAERVKSNPTEYSNKQIKMEIF